MSFAYREQTDYGLSAVLVLKMHEKDVNGSEIKAHLEVRK